MANAIQAFRNVYDIVKASKDNEKPLTNECIQMLLEHLVDDSALKGKYKRFERGYAAEDLFMRIYSLLPWVKLITPLGQEQFPEQSKEDIQVADYEVIYEIGDKYHDGCVLVETKLVDGDKETQEIKKYQYEVLKSYSEKKKEDILYALFWRRYGLWTLVPIDAYNEKSSVYKISFAKACENDVSSIFGDYTFFFQDVVYRKSKYTSEKNPKTDYLHMHERYGRTLYEGLSFDQINFEKMHWFETPVLDCAFDFKEIQAQSEGDVSELIEAMDNLPYVYRLSHFMLKYLLKIFCYEQEDMYCHDNELAKQVFAIVDTVRRKCHGERYYLLPKRNPTTDRLFQKQFGSSGYIVDEYKRANQKEGIMTYVIHNE